MHKMNLLFAFWHLPDRRDPNPAEAHVDVCSAISSIISTSCQHFERQARLVVEKRHRYTTPNRRKNHTCSFATYRGATHLACPAANVSLNFQRCRYLVMHIHRETNEANRQHASNSVLTHVFIPTGDIYIFRGWPLQWREPMDFTRIRVSWLMTSTSNVGARPCMVMSFLAPVWKVNSSIYNVFCSLTKYKIQKVQPLYLTPMKFTCRCLLSRLSRFSKC